MIYKDPKKRESTVRREQHLAMKEDLSLHLEQFFLLFFSFQCDEWAHSVCYLSEFSFIRVFKNNGKQDL